MNSILIANRGEIACRIIKTCRKMGIKAIAVYSDIDRNALFVQQADQAVYIGGNTPNESYLNQNAIIQAAKQTGAEGIHPGYGFLSENADFARRCQQENIILIAPNADAIEAMGDKAKAKALMQAHNVPTVRGYNGEEQKLAVFQAEAPKIGFPVLLKASAGGGGKGMRIVQSLDELEQAFHTAKREATNAFGNDHLIMEQYISSGRHIEFQIFGDKLGNVLHLLERECTIQRRHQKLIEESPSSIMTAELRAQMGEVATNAAKALRYDNAGTVEFIYNDQTGEFFFLEVNTRLQVEHCVTEEITGLDLVQMQIESAMGLPLMLQQQDVRGKGYAIEVRLYAEDMANNFMPQTGKVLEFNVPSVQGLRVETAVQNGSEISIFYDHTIAKLIVWGSNRAEAHRKMEYTLRQMLCLGIISNQDFLLHILQNQDFKAGRYNTHFIQQKLDIEALAAKPQTFKNLALIGATLWDWHQRENQRHLLKALPSGWRNNFNDYQKEVFTIEEQPYNVQYRFLNQEFIFILDGKESRVKLQEVQDSKLKLELEGILYQLDIAQIGHQFFVHNEQFGNLILEQQDRLPKKIVEKPKGVFEAPMPSQVVKILVQKGQEVRTGQALVVLSSMKIENTLVADIDGIIQEILVQENTNVEAGTVLLKIEH